MTEFQEGPKVTGVIENLLSCDITLYSRQIFARKSKIFLKNPVSKLCYGISSLFVSILRNFTFHQNQMCCSNGHWIRAMHENGNYNDKFLFPSVSIIDRTDPFDRIHPELTLQHKSLSLRFVSCGGENRVKSNAFGEFFSSFDKYNSICMISYVFIMTWLSKFVFKSVERFEGHLVTTAKLLLEQGGPLPDDIVNHKVTQVFAVGMLISAVVLSNAYKNNNVYNMITEREDIPYTLVSQLAKDKFSIYTRRTDFNIGKLNQSVFCVPFKLHRHDLHHAAAGIFISYY